MKKILKRLKIYIYKMPMGQIYNATLHLENLRKETIKRLEEEIEENKIIIKKLRDEINQNE